ncbi:MAG: hypothetical protein SFU86_07695, partial [Pirellulaceae bacterium]|nr:hypothetical protein [Pirellulaceae bacterium]
MEFRRSGQLDERRRRVLMDELAQPADTENAEAAPAGGGSAKGPVRAYSPAVLAERQPRLTELLPQRPLWAGIVVLIALTAVAAIECSHIHALTLAPKTHRAQLAALDVSQRGSVASWFSSLLLGTSAVLAVVAFSIRRHRVDDYRGRYRVWLWMAGALAWGSLDAATQIHDSIGLLVAHLAGEQLGLGSLAAACRISWLAIYSLVFGTLAIRLALEVWQSTAAFAALGFAGLGYLVAILGQMEMLPSHGPLVDSTVQGGILLLAHVAIFSTVALFARHVALDATGRLKVYIDPDKNRRTKPKAKPKLKVVKDESAVKKADKSEKTEAKPATAPAAEKSATSQLKFATSAPLAKAN